MGPRSTKEPWSRVPRNLTNDANNAVRDAILNDATRFPGGDIDAAISTRAVPGDAMALTAAERLIVQALIINDLTPFAGADVAAILADTATIVWADVTSIKTQTDKWPGTDTAGSHGPSGKCRASILPGCGWKPCHGSSAAMRAWMA